MANTLKRMSNPHHKEHSKRAHERTAKTKTRRKALNAGAADANRILRASGEMTPWEEACAKRRKRREKVRAKAGGQS